MYSVYTCKPFGFEGHVSATSRLVGSAVFSLYTGNLNAADKASVVIKFILFGNN